MSASDSWKLLVFRDGKRVLKGPGLLRALLRQIENVLSLSDFDSQFARDELIDALLRAGELECALADREGCEPQSLAIAEVTDALARALVALRAPNFAHGSLGLVSKLRVPERLTLSPPEGFCYYALHPLDCADLLKENAIDAGVAAVIGIRSIGATLSSVVRAWFEVNGRAAERITVRPTGHPFDRKLSFTAEQRQWIAGNLERSARFFVVDEGPGLSGSSFLAVAEALVETGTPHDRIVLVPSSEPNLGALLAADAQARWRRFPTLPLKPTRYVPEDAAQFVGGGEWRRRVFKDMDNDESEWPAVWSWTERQKYLSADGGRIFRFDGHGHYGKTVRQRSEILAAAGWGPATSSAGNGFSVSPWLDQTRAPVPDRNAVIQLARYCAFRARHFGCDVSSNLELERMARVNLDRALGVSSSLTLPIERPVVSDARMMPHEWIRNADGRLLKVDAASHGDDHFYPGPTDIAWDLAGAMVEWRLDRQWSELLVSEYTQVSDDRIDRRLPTYLLAYCVFRLAFSLSAGMSVSKIQERTRFEREAGIYRQRLETLLHLSTAA